jgi:hypothetical protein
MLITIRDKHTGEEKDFEKLYELHTDSVNICMVIESKNGWKKPYSFNKRDYEIAYIG